MNTTKQNIIIESRPRRYAFEDYDPAYFRQLHLVDGSLPVREVEDFFSDGCACAYQCGHRQTFVSSTRLLGDGRRAVMQQGFRQLA